MLLQALSGPMIMKQICLQKAFLWKGFKVSWLSVNLWVEAIRKHLSCSKAAGCVSKSVGVGKQRPKISSVETMNALGSFLLGQHW